MQPRELFSWFWAILSFGAVLLGLIWKMPDYLPIDALLALIIFRVFLWRHFFFRVNPFEAVLLMNGLIHSRNQSLAQTINQTGGMRGLRVAGPGFNSKKPWENKYDIVPIKKYLIQDAGETAGTPTASGEQVFVDYECFVGVYWRYADRYYLYTNGGGSMENIIVYLRDQIEGFIINWVQSKSLIELRSNNVSFNIAFQNFIKTDPNLRGLMQRFGVVMTEPNISSVQLSKQTRDAGAKVKEMEQETAAVKVLIAADPTLTFQQAMRLYLATIGRLEIREENLNITGANGVQHFVYGAGGGGKGGKGGKKGQGNNQSGNSGGKGGNGP